jgi:SAM-dependent methyltransferase
MDAPLPPVELMARVGGPIEDYLAYGSAWHRDFVSLLPSSFGWKGAHILDFGCGAGRVLREFSGEADAGAHITGCDIDRGSIDWIQAHLCPPFSAFANDELPPLPLTDNSLDLVYSMSVFTHLAETWSAWLLEMHRILKPDGILLATILGPGAEGDLGRPWDEDRIGFVVTLPDESFVGVRSGPIVYHSEWWVRAHWGRAFDIFEYWPYGFGAGGPDKVDRPLGQGCVAMRKRDVALSAEDLERRSDDPREWASLAENLDVVQGHEAAWRARAKAAEAELSAIRGTRSWRLARLLSNVGRPLARSPRPPDGG